MTNTEDLVKVQIRLPDTFNAELLWAKPVGNNLYRLMNIPFDAMGYSEGDIVRTVPTGNMPTVVEIQEDSGNGTLRLFFKDSSNTEAQEILNELVSVGCTYERASSSTVGLTVPPTLELPFSQLANYLNSVDDRVLAAWEVAKKFTRSATAMSSDGND
ncbi:MAG: hypothetical protein B6D41_10090 [Chloroflexi bacterium UTCFX4]|jgi:hypothetical protein|nr:MAG: hypothetical protein B6D41_10090 [Chloroflexi bacterium UTCFX4]